jgi:hypothetical protein
MVPVEGIEPTLLAEHDFESCASTSSATPACALSITPRTLPQNRLTLFTTPVLYLYLDRFQSWITGEASRVHHPQAHPGMLQAAE